MVVAGTGGRVVVVSGRAVSTSGGDEGVYLFGCDQLGCQPPIQPLPSSSFFLVGLVP